MRIDDSHSDHLLKKEIKNILQKAIDNGRITIDKLNPDVRKIVLEN